MNAPRPRPPAAPRRDPRRRRSACARRRRARGFGTRRLQPEQPRQRQADVACRAHWSRPAPPGRAGAAAAGRDARRPPRPAPSGGKPSIRGADGIPATRRAAPRVRSPAAGGVAGGIGALQLDLRRQAAGCAWRRWRTPDNCGSARTGSFGQLWSPRMPMRFQQSSTSASVACSSVTSGLLRRAPAACARLVVAFRGDQRGQMQQGLRDDWAAGTGPCGKRPAPGASPAASCSLADRSRRRSPQPRCARAIASFTRPWSASAPRSGAARFRPRIPICRDGWPAAPQGGPDGAGRSGAGGRGAGRATPAARQGRGLEQGGSGRRRIGAAPKAKQCGIATGGNRRAVSRLVSAGPTRTARRPRACDA